MTLENRLLSLKNKHEKLEEKIKKSYSNHEKEEIINNLKKEKLKIREEIEGIKELV